MRIINCPYIHNFIYIYTYYIIRRDTYCFVLFDVRIVSVAISVAQHNDAVQFPLSTLTKEGLCTKHFGPKQNKLQPIITWTINEFLQSTRLDEHSQWGGGGFLPRADITNRQTGQGERQEHTTHTHKPPILTI